MVDFQERDTRRSLGGDEDDDDDEDTDASDDAAEESASGADVGEPEPEPDEPEAEAGRDLGDHGHYESHDDEVHDHGHEDHSHGHHAHDLETLGVAVVTVSSSRTREDDPSGDVIESHVEGDGHEVVARDVVRDDFDGVQGAVDNLVGRDDVDVVVTTGGTGVTPDDVTIEAVEALFEKELPGFGELFRLLSHDEIGTKVVATRAAAGIADGVPVFCLPGSENAARLGIAEIILEEAPHLAGLATRE
jgi:molybdenum cofactor biosynthesis protein B